MNLEGDEYLTMSAAAKHSHVVRQAIFNAIKSGKLPAKKKHGRWYVKKSDVEHYRLNKYNRDMIQRQGEYVFDIEKGHFSVQQVAKVISASIGYPYPAQSIYYLLRTGQLKAFRKGVSWVIEREAAIDLLEKEMEKQGFSWIDPHQYSIKK